MGMTITRRPRTPKINWQAIATAIKAYAPGQIIERTGRGIGSDNKQFAPYSKQYLDFLRRGGEATNVDLRVSGGLLNSIKARKTEITDTRVTVTIAPDAGTSPRLKPKSGGRERYARAMERFKRAGERGDYSSHLAGRQASKAYRMQKTGERSPPHNVLAYLLHYGKGKLPARPFMGLTDEQMSNLLKLIQRVMFKWL